MKIVEIFRVDEHNRLRMILDLELTVQSHIRVAILKARGSSELIRYLPEMCLDTFLT